MKRTPLYDIHKSLGAKIVDFSGWEMPLQYQGIIAEHQAVRNAAGLFDVSHMGVIDIEGLGAVDLLQSLSTNDLSNKADGTATYTVWCNDKGGVIDDLIVYKKSANHFFVVANASNRYNDLEHLLKYSRGKDVTVTERFDSGGILALQGPASTAILQTIFPEAAKLAPMHLLSSTYHEKPVDIARSGYTGETGYEIFAPNEVLVPLWKEIMLAGASHGIQPTGLGARDTLRLEMGYALYGHELDAHINPAESVSAWTIKSSHPFLGSDSIKAIEHSPKKRYQYGVTMVDPRIARQGYEVYLGDKKIGVVTSGTFSPTLQHAIAIVLVDTKLHPDDIVTIEIRNTRCRAKVGKLPFLQRAQTHKG